MSSFIDGAIQVICVITTAAFIVLGRQFLHFRLLNRKRRSFFLFFSEMVKNFFCRERERPDGVSSLIMAIPHLIVAIEVVLVLSVPTLTIYNTQPIIPNLITFIGLMTLSIFLRAIVGFAAGNRQLAQIGVARYMYIHTINEPLL